MSTAARLFLLLIMITAWSAPAFADEPYADLETALAQPEITIGSYILAKDDLAAFYAANNNHAQWNFAGSDNAGAFAGFLASLDKVIAYHGLSPDDYPIDEMKALASADNASDSGSSMQLELLVTDTLLHLAHALHGDVFDLDKFYPGWNFHRDDLDIPATLAAAVASNSLETYVASLAPKNPAYAKLADALATYTAFQAAGGWPTVESGPIIRPKDNGPRVAEMRARLVAENYLAPIADPTLSLTAKSAHAAKVKVDRARAAYDADLKDAVIKYQNRNGLVADGQVGEKSIEAMNVSAASRVDQIRANMERWRHIPDNFPPSRYIYVNIPDASVMIVDDTKPVYKGLVIVGKVDRKTPFIQSFVHSMIINPSWHVPTKIAQKDILPKLQKDPHYLEKLGFVIKGSEDDPHGEKIDWKSMHEHEFNYHLRQEPGDQNSLGRIKFDFDNDFAVYMHGTPHQELFKKNVRNLSSGCVRLQEPEQVATILMSGNKETWPVERIDSEIATAKTHWVGITNPWPIFIMYWTVFPDDDDHIEFRNDVYAYDSFLIENMNAYSKGEPLQPAMKTSPAAP